MCVASKLSEGQAELANTSFSFGLPLIFKTELKKV
jgi:hypothetical protein